MNNKEQIRLIKLFANIVGTVLILASTTGEAAPAVVQATTPAKESTQAKQAMNVQSEQAATRKKRKVAAQVEQAANTDAVGKDSKTTELDDDFTPTTTPDPLERFNRGMFQFNDLVDVYIAKPVATFYNIIMPKPLNQGIHNFFNNMGELPTIANDILQFNLYQALNDAWRFTINTTLGIAGFFDIASRIGLPYYANDFGLTLAIWGYKDSTYIVIPFWGPRTVRDGIIGLPVDYFAFSAYPYIHPQSTRYGIYALSVLDARAQLLQFQPVFEEVAVDKYVFMRNAYMQRRAFQIKEAEKSGSKQSSEEPIASTD